MRVLTNTLGGVRDPAKGSPNADVAAGMFVLVLVEVSVEFDCRLTSLEAGGTIVLVAGRSLSALTARFFWFQMRSISATKSAGS